MFFGAVVDQIFVRRGPSFGDSERRRNNDDPSVGFAYPTQKKDAKNDRSDDRMKNTHFETKAKKGREHKVSSTVFWTSIHDQQPMHSVVDEKTYVLECSHYGHSTIWSSTFYD